MAQVHVACKLPNGHVIAVGEKSATLRGARDAQDGSGFGITAVDKELWDAWYKQHADAKYRPLVAGLIFAHEKVESTRAEADEKAEVKSGFEGMPQEVDGITEEDAAKKTRAGKSKV